MKDLSSVPCVLILLQNGSTALLMASQSGHIQVAELLFREGKCDPHLKNEVIVTERPFTYLD